MIVNVMAYLFFRLLLERRWGERTRNRLDTSHFFTILRCKCRYYITDMQNFCKVFGGTYRFPVAGGYCVRA